MNPSTTIYIYIFNIYSCNRSENNSASCNVNCLSRADSQCVTWDGVNSRTEIDNIPPVLFQLLYGPDFIAVNRIMYIYGICKKVKIVEDIAVYFNGEIARTIQGEDNALPLGLWNDAV